MRPFRPEDFLVLTVDDVNLNLQVVGLMLDRAGYETSFASNGEETLARVASDCPDLILLDLMMPDISGLEVCKRLKSDPVTAEIPIVFLTASSEKEHTIAAFAAGAVDYITKPFNAPELLARVRTHLELKHTRDELKQALVELERLAHTDPLTEVANRRHWLDLAEREFDRARRYDSTFGVVLLDLDWFKQINDRYGHGTGDDVLVAVSRAVEAAIRRSDVLGRFGGEEFVILLPETDFDEILSVAERVRLAIAALAVPMRTDGELPTAQSLAIGASGAAPIAPVAAAPTTGGHNGTSVLAQTPLPVLVQPTASLGLAVLQPDDRAVETLLSRADRGLYGAKLSGRNCIAAELPTGLEILSPQRAITRDPATTA